MKKILSLMMLMLFFSGLIMVFIPQVSAFGFNTGFEDGTLNSDYNNGWMSSASNDPNVDTFEVDNHQVRTGTRSFYIDGGAEVGAWWNYSYSSSTFLTAWEGWGYMDTTGGSAYILFYFYDSADKPGNFDTDSLIVLKLYESGEKMTYFDHNGAEQEVGSGSFDNQAWHKFGFEITGVDTVSYFVNDTIAYGTTRHVINNTERINTVRIHYIGTPDFSFDDHVIEFSSAYGMGSYGDLGDYTGVGSMGNYDRTYVFNYSFVEWMYYKPINGNAIALDVAVSGLQYAFDSDVSNYYAYINNYPRGNPDYFIDMPNYYVLRWIFVDLPVELDNVDPVIELYHNKADSYGIYWYIRTGAKDVDIDGDGYARIYAHSNFNLQNGMVDDGCYIDSRDVLYRLYLDDITYPDDDFEFDDTLGLHGFEGNHTVYDIPFTYEYNTVYFSYTLSTMESNTYMTLYHDGVKVGATQGFPIFLTTPGGVQGFTPYDEGNYTVHLYRNNVNVTNASFYAVNTPETNLKIIWTTPNPSVSLEPYFVHTIFNHSVVYDVYVACFTTSDTTTWGNAIYKTHIDNNYSYFKYNPSTPNDVYWQLYVNLSGTMSPIGGNHRHSVIDIYSAKNYITPLFFDMYYDPAIPGWRQQMFSGHHSFLNCDVFIRVNGVTVENVGATSSFSDVPYQVTSPGTHLATLELLTTTGFITIASDDYRVYSEEETKIIGASDTGINALLRMSIPDPTVRFIIGIAICVLITFLPFIVVMRLGKKTVHIPSILYVICFSVGTMACYFLGFFPWEVAFFFCFCVISIQVLFWIKGEKIFAKES